MTDPQKPKPEVVLRPVKKEDVPFIFNSWLKSYRDASQVAGVPNTLYYAEQHRIIEEILSNSATRVIIACSPDDHDQMFGYVVYKAPLADTNLCVHWIYVKHSFRMFGIARMIYDLMTDCSARTFTYSHTTKISAKLVKKFSQFVYNPFILRSKDL